MKRPSYKEVAKHITQQGSCRGVSCASCPFGKWISMTNYGPCDDLNSIADYSKIAEKAEEYLAKPKKPKEKITKKQVEEVLTQAGENLSIHKGIAVYAFPTSHTASTQPPEIYGGGGDVYLVGYFPLEKS